MSLGKIKWFVATVVCLVAIAVSVHLFNAHAKNRHESIIAEAQNDVECVAGIIGGTLEEDDLVFMGHTSSPHMVSAVVQPGHVHRPQGGVYLRTGLNKTGTMLSWWDVCFQVTKRIKRGDPEYASELLTWAGVEN